jgi:hypothetical protein
MLTIERLLSNGYLPRELPPPFNSISFGKFVHADLKNFRTQAEKAPTISKPTTYYLGRAGDQRRKLSLVNPVHYFRLSDVVTKEWPSLEAQANRSALSMSLPITTGKERALERKVDLGKLPEQRANIRSSARYILSADIQHFYGSIYTHSIPWAIHTKATAKRNRSIKQIGNLLDTLVRNAQDQQTLGIPIGPDTSLLIAEMLLAPVDEQLVNEFEVLGFRYVDDYELAFNDLGEANRVRYKLHEVLGEYQLSLSPTKAKILTLPFEIEETWTSELRVFPFRNDRQQQKADLLHYFNRVFQLARDFPTLGVLKYAIARFKTVNIEKENWPLFENLLLQSATVETGTLRFVLSHFLAYHPTRWLNEKAIQRCLDGLIKHHAVLGNTSEVAWAIWGAILLKLVISEEAGQAIAKMNNSVVYLLALDAQQNGLVAKKVQFSYASSMAVQDQLYGEHWLFAYEAAIKDWALPSNALQYVNKDMLFDALRKNSITFYDVTKAEELRESVIPDKEFDDGDFDATYFDGGEGEYGYVLVEDEGEEGDDDDES